MQPDEVFRLIIERLEAAIVSGDGCRTNSECKAISALLPYAAWEERHGKRVTLDAISRIMEASRAPTWNHVVPTVLNGNSPRTTLLASHHMNWLAVTWGDKPPTSDHENMISQWAAAVSAVPYTEEVGQSVVNTLLRIASTDILQPYIPIGVWAWLEKVSSLPPKCYGWIEGTEGHAFHQVRALGDIKILKSYLLLIWSEWVFIPPDGVSGMCASIRSDFSGIGMRHHRKDLINRLDHVLGQLDRGLGYLRQHKQWMNEWSLQQAKERYGMIRGVLLDVDRRRCKPLLILPGMIDRLTC